MKKTLKITGIVLASILLLLIIIPITFKGKIKDIVITQGNKMLNAEFNFETLNISLIRNFPRATVTIKDFAIWGKDDFAQDTLASADKISATVNIMSLFSDSGYEISRVELSGADIKAVVLEDGRPNWDIMKPSDEPTDTVAVDSGDSDFRIMLKKVTLSNIDLIYDDRQSGMYASLDDLNLVLSGDMSAEHTVMKIKTEIEKVYFKHGGIPYVNNMKASAKIDVDADLKNMRFELQDNVFSLNAIVASVDGMFAILPENAGYDMDLTLKTDKVGFKELLSMVPAIYAKDFQSMKASGDVMLSAWVKGKMSGDDLPAFDASLNVSAGSFRYPSLPAGVDNINIAASAKSPGGNADLVTVDVNPLSLTMAGNPFSANLHLSTPVSDPAFTVTAKGIINLGMVKDVYPLEDMELNGTLNANLNLKGRMSYVEKEQYDKLQAAGTLGITNMVVKMKDMPNIDIKKSTFTFTPQYLNLSETTVNIGQSDVTADCRFENYMGFAFKNQTIKGKLNIRSNNLNLNELMGNETADATEDSEDGQAENTSSGALKVPTNIDFDMNTNLKKVIYDNIVLDNVAGQVIMRGGKLDMRNLSFNTLGGGVVANGYYSTADGVDKPELNAAFKMNQVSFKETFKTFVTVQKIVPIFENLNGNFSGNFSFNTRMDGQMNPVYNTMGGEGGLTTSNLNLSGIGIIDKIADATGNDKLKNITVKDMSIHFTIKEGRVHTKPFDIKMGDTNLNLTGSTGIDETIDYSGKISLPPSTGIGKYTSVDLKIGGTFASPKISIDTKSMVEQAAKVAISEALGEAGKKLGIDISDATKQRETLIEQAQKAGDKLVEEAQKQTDKLIDEAGSNVIAKMAAQVAAKKLVDAAKKQSANLVKKATEEGDKLIEKTNKGEQ